MTPLEKYATSFKKLQEEFETRKNVLREILKNDEQNCEHKFGQLISRFNEI